MLIYTTIQCNLFGSEFGQLALPRTLKCAFQFVVINVVVFPHIILSYYGQCQTSGREDEGEFATFVQQVDDRILDRTWDFWVEEYFWNVVSPLRQSV